MQICTTCVEAMSQQELAGLRERSRIPERPMGLRPSEFIFPEKCCSCLGPAETKTVVSSSRSQGAVVKTLSIQVPVCRKCSKRGNLAAYFLAGGIVLGAVIGLAAGGIGPGVGGGLLGGTAGALVGYMATKIADPASIDQNGSISFRNPKYEALFRAANSRS